MGSAIRIDTQEDKDKKDKEIMEIKWIIYYKKNNWNTLSS